ncbi:MAG TPA: LacI family transcriptional regulator, partial [Marinilabiliaceae bacterium]|nr:LacI family transcriptional regulator [Marinilabiliaceae bacterium]
MFMKRVTIIDIATALGITPSTVSRALTGSSRVSEATRQKVQEKAEELGYRTNVVASSLRRGRSDTVGMLVPRINRNFFSHVISAVEEVLNPAGYNLLICQSHERSDIEKQAMKVLLNNRVAGII